MALECNSKMSVSADGPDITSLGGMFNVAEFMNKIQFPQLVDALFQPVDKRRYCKYTNTDLVCHCALRLIAGYDKDSAANQLANDPLLSNLDFIGPVPRQTDISRFITRVGNDQNGRRQLHLLNSAVARQYEERNPHRRITVDIDSTHLDTFGKQEGSAWNSHYKAYGYHPFVAYDAQAKLLLSAVLRPGNNYTSLHAEDYVEALQREYPNHQLLFRGDSGFAKPALYESVEEHHNHYVLAFSHNTKIDNDAVGFFNADTAFQVQAAPKTKYYEEQYRAHTWGGHKRRMIICAEQGVNETVPYYLYYVTNMTVPARRVVEIYRARGTMEDYIKESKNGFAMAKTDSHRMADNEVRMMMGVLAYNLTRSMALLTLLKKWRDKLVATLRTHIFYVGAVLTSHARGLHLSLAQSDPDNALIYRIWKKIQRLDFVV
nr:IS1380 family transposase [Schleiferilactobacillus shenzhenensis]